MVMEKKGCIDPKKGLQYECSLSYKRFEYEKV